MMKIVMLLLGFMSSGHAGIVSATTPSIHFSSHEINTLWSAQKIDVSVGDSSHTISPNIDCVSFQQAISVPQLSLRNAAITRHGFFIASDKSGGIFRPGDAATIESHASVEANHVSQKTVSHTNAADDSRYYLFRSFRKQTPPKPASWTLLLTGLCLLLYQVRRRSVRVSIGLHSASFSLYATPDLRNILPTDTGFALRSW
ncbi:hypothetical protein RGU75_08335 [Glaciimonas sp. CA11.2]|uniref:hypothetical protein n=2 Tax=Glaciimonas sp. CA11.2 TaxID=3048601 RepID=UPI002AB4A6D6|nr:hypothetical protein [Glaciimonas sp. CA11.2]MDY7546239.1 hypothetical protein [Glaciimonas sp. CA11.2]